MYVYGSVTIACACALVYVYNVVLQQVVHAHTIKSFTLTDSHRQLSYIYMYVHT